MASPVNIRAEVGGADEGETCAAVADALDIFYDVDRTCTRFTASSDSRQRPQ